jgi:hypothetical protein
MGGINMRSLRNAFLYAALSAALAALVLQIGDDAAMARVRGCGAAAMPVCGVRKDGPKNYANACLARADGARMVHPGECQPILCWHVSSEILFHQAMCGRDPLNHALMTYPNRCAAEHAAANWVHDGPCRGGRRG